MKPVEFDPNAFEDLAWWIHQDRKTALYNIKLIKEIQRMPFMAQVNQNHLTMICEGAGHDALTKNIS